jgi:hypothetical protein
MKIQIDTQSKRAVKELTQRSKRLKTKHGLVVVAPIDQIARTLKTKANTPGPGVIAQWTGTRGPEGSGFIVQTPVGKSLWASVTELDWGVPMACQVGSAIVLPKKTHNTTYNS